ncbi:hypothetical protein [Roseomonas sp. BN140053]|uniref:hypothetical protein n=1 Tax=Roseomonas sp. BN140053 TaxID=3391898 RepID=UPI0039EC0B90
MRARVAALAGLRVAAVARRAGALAAGFAADLAAVAAARGRFSAVAFVVVVLAAGRLGTASAARRFGALPVSRVMAVLRATSRGWAENCLPAFVSRRFLAVVRA